MYFEKYDKMFAINLMKKVYKFKVFKKTTKFKRYNRGITKFILNRKKYILRKKRGPLQFKLFNIYFWTKSYSKMRHSIRFLQSLHCFKTSIILSSNILFNKLALKMAIGYNFYCISKKYFFNSSLFNKNILLNFHSLFNNNKIGFIGLNKEFKELGFDITKTYVLTETTQQYTTMCNTGTIYKNIYNRLFINLLFLVKSIRRIYLLLVLKTLV